MARKEVAQKMFLKDGAAVTVRVVDGLLIDDILMLSMKAEGYRLITGREAFPVVTRKLRDYLIRTGVLQE